MQLSTESSRVKFACKKTNNLFLELKKSVSREADIYRLKLAEILQLCRPLALVVIDALSKYTSGSSMEMTLVQADYLLSNKSTQVQFATKSASTLNKLLQMRETTFEVLGMTLAVALTYCPQATTALIEKLYRKTKRVNDNRKEGAGLEIVNAREHTVLSADVLLSS